jgi:murein L,D-transpeptidase YcbB/YkuD
MNTKAHSNKDFEFTLNLYEFLSKDNLNSPKRELQSQTRKNKCSPKTSKTFKHFPNKMRSKRKIFIVLALLILSMRIDAQDSLTLKKFINNSSFSTYGLQYPIQVKEFYNYTGFQYSWLKSGGSRNLKLLSNYLQHSAALGLQKEDYQPALFKTVFNNSFFANNEQDSSLAEVKFTDAAIHFIHDILIGNQNVSLAYNGLNYTPSCYNIPAILKNYLNNNKFENLVTDLEPAEAGYLAIKKKLNFFQQKISSADFTDIVVKPSKQILNHTLIKRLYQLGFIGSDTSGLSEYILTQKIKEAQHSFNLSDDGIAGRTTLQALNPNFAVASSRKT